MPFPKRDYFTLNQVADRWGTDLEQVKYSIFHDGLEACCWFDRREVNFYEFAGASSYLDWVSGYVGIFPEDCRRIFRPGDIYVRRFFMLDGQGAYFRIADHEHKALIHPSEVFVRLSSCREFEKEFDLVPSHDDTLVIQDSHTFYYNGEKLSLGGVQKEVLRILIEARGQGMPWVNVKILLERAGSQAVRIRDIFKRTPIWKELMESDKSGHYRLREDLAVEYITSPTSEMKKAA